MSVQRPPPPGFGEGKLGCCQFAMVLISSSILKSFQHGTAILDRTLSMLISRRRCIHNSICGTSTTIYQAARMWLSDPKTPHALRLISHRRQRSYQPHPEQLSEQARTDLKLPCSSPGLGSQDRRKATRTLSSRGFPQRSARLIS